MENYNSFKDRLIELTKENEISIFYRGISKKDASKIYKIDLENFQIEQFAEKLFFYGNKSIHFMQKKLNSKYEINDISDNIFEFIFSEFHNLKDSKNKRTLEFISKNKHHFDFFFEKNNNSIFVNKIKSQSEDNIKASKNYLLSTLHQIGNFSSYKKKSHFVSSSSKIDVAKNFSENGIIINFWRPNFEKKQYNGIYLLNSFVYPEQEEHSVFTAIFPHYIYSFTFDKIEYFNPYIDTCYETDFCIYFGLDILQDNFIPRLHSETEYNKGVESENDELKEI